MQSTKQATRTLRLRGKSYNEIARTLGVSKSTVSYWLHNFPLTPLAQKRLLPKIQQAEKHGLLTFNRQRSLHIKKENIYLKTDATKEIPILSHKDLFLIGVALYWGEGYQSENNHHNSYRLSFVNSNPSMIGLFLRFLREILKVDEERIRAQIHLHNNVNKNKALKFWSHVTRLPTTRFVLVHQISRASKQKRPIRILPHGTLDIRVNNRKIFMRMKGWINGLARQSPIEV